MAECRHGAVLVITGDVEGTTTNVVRRRVELTCGLPSGHQGAHQDATHGEHWEAKEDHPTLVRHEDEPPDPEP